MFPPSVKRNRYPWSPAPTSVRTPPFLNPPVDEQEELGQMTGQPIEDQSIQAPDRSGTQYRDRAMEEVNTPRQKVGLGRKLLGGAVGLFVNPEWGQEIMRPGERERKQSIFTAAELEGQMEKSDLERMEAQRRQEALGEDMRSNRATEAYRNQDLGLRNRQLDEMGADRDANRDTTRSNRLLQMGAELMTQPREAYPPGSYFTKDPLTGDDIVIVPRNQRDMVPTPPEWRQKYPYLQDKIPEQMYREIQGKMMTGDMQSAHDQRMLDRSNANQSRMEDRAAQREQIALDRYGRGEQSKGQQELRMAENRYTTLDTRLKDKYQPFEPSYVANSNSDFEVSQLNQAERQRRYLAERQALLDQLVDEKNRIYVSRGIQRVDPHLDARTGQPKGQPQSTQQPTQPTQPTPVVAQGGDTPPISALKEGVNTTFGNGQTWTLRGGQPFRIK